MTNGIGSVQNRIAKILIVAIFAISWTVTAIHSQWIGPGFGPDENHHFSYAHYISENPTDFTVDFEKMHTVKKSIQNHLVHPPLYYFLAAAFIRLSNVLGAFSADDLKSEEHLPEIYDFGIMTLRMLSLILNGVGYLYLALALFLFIRKEALSPWAATLFALGTSFLPSVMYVSATVNNDVLGLALWPAIVYTLARFHFDRKPADFFLSLILINFLILTKATLWPMALVSGIFLLYSFGIAERAAYSYSFKKLIGIPKLFLSHPIWATLVITASALTLLYLGGNLVKYGQIQPLYTDVRGLPPTAAKFYNPPTEANEMSISLQIKTIWFAAWRTLLGVLGKAERINVNDYELRFWVFVSSAVLLISMAATAVARTLRAGSATFEAWRKTSLAVYLLGAVLLFSLVFMTSNFEMYETYRHLSVQGRYLAGYLSFALLGLGIISTSLFRQFRGIKKSVPVTLFALATVPLADPAMYLRHSHEPIRATELLFTKIGELELQGFKRIDLSESDLQKLKSPERTKGGLGRAQPQWSFRSGRERGVVKFSVQDNASCVSLALLGRGWPEAPTELNLHFGNSAKQIAHEKFLPTGEFQKFLVENLDLGAGALGGDEILVSLSVTEPKGWIPRWGASRRADLFNLYGVWVRRESCN